MLSEENKREAWQTALDGFLEIAFFNAFRADPCSCYSSVLDNLYGL